MTRWWLFVDQLALDCLKTFVFQWPANEDGLAELTRCVRLGSVAADQRRRTHPKATSDREDGLINCQVVTIY